jgi:predicted nucleotidyltransferase
MNRGPDADNSIAETVRDVLVDHPVRLGVLFGSHARTESGVHSDVDVAVEFDRSVAGSDPYSALLVLVADLTRALDTDDVDVVDLDSVRPEVGRSALSDAVVLVGDPDRVDRLARRFDRRTDTPAPAERRRRFDEVLERLRRSV